MVRAFFLFFCLVSSLVFYAQNDVNISALKKAINKKGSQNENIENLIRICQYYKSENEDSCVKYAKILEKRSREYKHAKGIFKACTYQINSYYVAGQYRQCLNPFLKCFKEIKPLNDTETEVAVLNKISITYLGLRESDSSVIYNELALDLSLKANYQLGKVMSFEQKGVQFYLRQKLDSALYYLMKGQTICDSLETSNHYCASICKRIGRILVHQDEHEKAISRYKQAQMMFMENGNVKAFHTTNMSIANVLVRMGKYKEAEPKLDSSYAYFKSNEYYSDQINCLFEMSNLAIEQKHYEKNLKYCQEIELLRAENNIVLYLSLNKAIGRAYYYVNDFRNAKRYLEMALEEAIANKSKSNEENALKYLSKTYAKQGDYKNGCKLYEQYIEVHESNEILKNTAYTSQEETKYQSAKKEREIEVLKSKNQLAEQRKQNQLNILFSIIVITSLLGFLFFMLYRNRQKTSRKLEEIDSIKTQFFENISHEFRTPLTLIKLPISQAISKGRSLDDYELNLMHNNASRLQNLIEDLLSLSELDAGKMLIKKTEQDPLNQVKTLSSQFDSYAESKNISYHKVIERNTVKATYDKAMVDKVLSNLISNAIKYSDTGGEVQVSVSIVEQQLVMKVSDKGYGLAPAEQDKIFERFYRIHESDEGTQGSGIGLALVKKLLEINNGTIEVTSKIHEGSTFTATVPLENLVKLPFEPSEAKLVKKIKTIPEKEDLLDVIDISEKPKLLIVEDNKDLLAYITRLFKHSFQITQAVDGEDAMQKAIAEVPDFIVSDWMMPNKNGLELCKEIKTNAITSHIPFLLLTAKSDVEDKIEGYEMGADAYFSKPFNFNELQSRIHGIIKQRQLLYEKYSNSNLTLASTSSNTMDVKFWKEFKQVLKENIQESNLSSTVLAESLGMSRMQLHRKLKALTGKSVSAIVNSHRMSLATELLKDPAKRISDVCYEIGFEDRSAFSRAFKKEFGNSPTQFREKLNSNRR